MYLREAGRLTWGENQVPIAAHDRTAYRYPPTDNFLDSLIASDDAEKDSPGNPPPAAPAGP